MKDDDHYTRILGPDTRHSEDREIVTDHRGRADFFGWDSNTDSGPSCSGAKQGIENRPSQRDRGLKSEYIKTQKKRRSLHVRLVRFLVVRIGFIILSNTCHTSPPS